MAASVSLESLQFGLIELRIPEDQIRYYVKKSYHRLVAYENGVIDFIKAIFWHLEPPRMSVENKVVGKDKCQIPPYKNPYINDRTPP